MVPQKGGDELSLSFSEVFLGGKNADDAVIEYFQVLVLVFGAVLEYQIVVEVLRQQVRCHFVAENK